MPPGGGGGGAQTAKNRLLEGRGEELMYMSRAIYEERAASGGHGDSDSDWKNAEWRLVRAATPQSHLSYPFGPTSLELSHVVG